MHNLTPNPGKEKTDLSIDPRFFSNLNLQRDWLAESNIKIIFFLKKFELEEMIRNASDFWSFRHKLIEMTPEEKITGEAVSISEFPDAGLTFGKTATQKWKAIQYREELLRQNPLPERRINILLELINFYYSLPEYQEAMDFIEEVLQLCRSKKNRDKKSVLLLWSGIINANLGNYNKALSFYHRAEKLKRELKDKQGIAQTLHHIGNIHYLHGEYEKANEKYNESMKIAEELEDKRGIAHTLHQIGMIHQHQGDYEKAIDKYNESLKIKKELGDKQGLATTLAQLGVVNRKLKKYEDAAKYSLTALEIFEKLKTTNTNIVQKNINKIKKGIGEERFKEIVGQLSISNKK